MQIEVLIVGGGLSGMHSAYDLNKPAVDLGASWFWPGQNCIYSLLDEIDLSNQRIVQSSKRAALFENNQGEVKNDIEGISMGGAYHLSGRIRQLIETLRHTLSKEKIITKAKVKNIAKSKNTIETSIQINNNNGFLKSALEASGNVLYAIQA